MELSAQPLSLPIQYLCLPFHTTTTINAAVVLEVLKEVEIGQEPSELMILFPLSDSAFRRASSQCYGKIDK